MEKASVLIKKEYEKLSAKKGEDIEQKRRRLREIALMLEFRPERKLSDIDA